MFKKVLIIANPVAGRGEATKYSEILIDLLKQEYSSEVQLKYTQQNEDARNWSQQAAQKGFDTVLCLGGDGTVSETVEGIINAEERPDFGFIPLGTVNDLGRALGYDMNPLNAIEDLRNVQVDKLDIGKVNDKIFINVLAMGPIAEEVMKTNAEDKNKFGVLAYIRDGLKVLFTDKGYKLSIKTSDGIERTIMTNLLFIGLTNSIGGIEFMLPEASYDDGLLHLAAIKGRTPIDMIRAGFDVGFANVNPQNFLKISDTSFEIKSIDDEEIIINLDGDTGPKLPLKINVLKHAIDVIVKRR